jgi:hypothetical protein
MEGYLLSLIQKIQFHLTNRKTMLGSFVGKIVFISNLVAVLARGVWQLLTLKAGLSDVRKEITWKVKYMKSKMGSNAAGLIILGALKEFVRHEGYFRYSSVGMEYSHLTDLGKERLNEIMEMNLALLRDSMEVDIREQAKELMMAELKK